MGTLKKTPAKTKVPFIELQHIDDGRDGSLTIVEAMKQVPFEIKRVYYINQLKKPGALRGKHAHKKLKQAIFCLQGSFDLLWEDGYTKEWVTLKKSYQGVYLPPMVWHAMTRFSKNCVIMVLASDFYKESDYIRDYNEFTQCTKKRT